MSKHPSKKNATAQLAAIFERNGYIRLQNSRRLSREGPRSYKKGSEVRLMAKSDAERVYVGELLDILGFTPGRPFAKGRQLCIPIYGRDQIGKFAELLGKHST